MGSISSTMAFQVTGTIKQAEGANEWTSGLCSCFDDIGSCCYAFCCPWCANATARTEYDGSNWLFNCFCVTPCLVRSILREGPFNINGTWIGDVLTSCCCMHCAIAQQLRQVRNGSVAADKAAAMNSNQWSTGLFSCFDDCGACLLGWCCLPCATAKARTDYDGSNCFFNFCALTICTARNIVREGEYHIEGSCGDDICMGCLCPHCVVCQLLRENNIRKGVSNNASQVITVQAAGQAPPGRPA